jgi:DNA/RNA-binding domain of Phe-tRNA-synthetase-like protein
MNDALTIDPHPLLGAAVFETTLPRPLGEIESPEGWEESLRLGAETPVSRDEPTRAAVRDLLRHGGFKPTGRNKPAAEYLVKAAESGRLGPINPAVDACNIVSLHSGLPISVVDLDRAAAPFRIGIAEEGARYVFNPSGQELDLGGLLVLFDGEGPCANAVKDSQRTKTHAGTRRTLSVIWGLVGDPERTRDALAWYRALLGELGAETTVWAEPAS